MEIEGFPWLFALVTATWFWWMATRANRTRTLWVVGGGAFGLVISALVMGLGRARCIPLSDHQQAVSELKWAVFAAVLILAGGWLLTSGLHRHHLALWRRFRPGLAASPAPINPSPKPGTAGPKPTIGKAQPSAER